MLSHLSACRLAFAPLPQPLPQPRVQRGQGPMGGSVHPDKAEGLRGGTVGACLDSPVGRGQQGLGTG